MRVLEKIYRWSAAFAGIVLFGLALMITTDVTIRWVTGKPILGVFEFSELSFLILTFLALALLEHRGREMRVDLFVSRIKGRPGSLLAAITALLGLGFWGIIVWQGGTDWLQAYAIHDRRQGLIEVPSIIHLGFLTFGTSLLCLVLLTQTLSYFNRIFHPEKGAVPPSEKKPDLEV